MLLVRPRPRAAESFRGFLLRLSTVNGLHSPELIPAAWADELAQRALGGSHPRGPIAGHRHFARADVGGLPSRYWNSRRPRYCPQCLSEDPTWLSLWELVFVTECPRHRIQLLDYCTSCARALRWRRPELLSCECGSMLIDARGVASEPEPLKVSSDLDRAWNGGQRSGLAQDGDLSVEELLHRTWFLGAYASRSARRALKLANLFDVCVARRIAGAACLPLEDGPSPLFALLDQVAGHYGNATSMRLTKRFGAMYKELFDPSSERALRDIREGFECYVESRWPGQLAARNSRISQEVRERHLWVPLTRAAKELGWKLPRLRSAIERGLVRGHITQHESGRASGTVHREDLTRLFNETRDEMTLHAVCGRLHLGKKRVKALVAAGTLQASSGPSIDRCTIWRFKRSDIDLLQESLSNSYAEAD